MPHRPVRAPLRGAGAEGATEPSMIAKKPGFLRRWFRRAPWEIATTALIGLGLLMLMQPFALAIFSYGFAVLLAGVVGYSIAGKLPKD